MLSLFWGPCSIAHLLHYWKMDLVCACINAQKNSHTVRNIFFLWVYRQKNMHRNTLTEKLQFPDGARTKKHLSDGCTHTQIELPRLKIIFVCVNPHRKIRKSHRKIIFLLMLSRQKNRHTHRKYIFILSDKINAQKKYFSDNVDIPLT
jgi:hypothetical protein